MSHQNEILLFSFQVCPEGGGDQNAGCGYWKKLGYCAPDQEYASFMAETCQASCGMCEGLFCRLGLGRPSKAGQAKTDLISPL